MDGIETLARWFHEASFPVVLTGAGISKESGIPTFREAQTGLWAQYDPEALASPEGFARDPGLVWRWYGWRRALVHQSTPNPGHHALATLGERLPALTVITQNVDGFHQAAGSRDVIELHGNILRFRCAARGHPADEQLADSSPERPPPCPQCGSPLRPDVIWFGEALPEAALAQAVAAARRTDLMVVVGTSGMVQPAASLPLIAAKRGIRVVEINPEETPLTSAATLHLGGAAGTILPAVVARYTQLTEDVT